MSFNAKVMILCLGVTLALEGVYCLRQQSLVEQRERTVREIDLEIEALQAEIEERSLRVTRLQHDVDLNVQVARDRMRVVRPGEWLMLLEE